LALMKRLTISDPESAILSLQDEIRRTEESRYDHRLHAVLLVAQGMSGRQVAQLLGDASRSVKYWVTRFEERGFSGLMDGARAGRTSSLSTAQLQALEGVLRKPPAAAGLSGQWDGKTLSLYLQRQWGISLGVRQCQRLFRQLGFRLRKPRPKMAHAEPDWQAAYKKLCVLARDDTVDLWAIDEVRFEQHGSACRMWVPPELKAPVLLHHPTRDGKFVYSREEGRFNADTFFAFMKKLQRAAVVLILDNVRYHQASLHREWRDKNRKRVSLEFMPPYSPELNSIERVWKLTRRKATHNRYFPTLGAVCHCVEDALDEWQTSNIILKRLCAL
jgi:transposase